MNYTYHTSVRRFFEVSEYECFSFQVLESVSPSLVAILVDGGAHHLDLRLVNITHLFIRVWIDSALHAGGQLKFVTS